MTTDMQTELDIELERLEGIMLTNYFEALGTNHATIAAGSVAEIATLGLATITLFGDLRYGEGMLTYAERYGEMLASLVDNLEALGRYIPVSLEVNKEEDGELQELPN